MVKARPNDADLTPLLRASIGRIRQELGRDRYRVNAKIPSYRTWAQRLEVSLFTIQRAMAILEKEGVLETQAHARTLLRAKPAAAARRAALSAVRITTWISRRTNQHKVLQALLRRHFLDQFKRLHPEIEVADHLVPGDMADYESALLVNLLTRSAPTLGHITQTYLPLLVENNAVAPLEGRNIEQYLEKMDPRCVQACSRNGRVYLAPTRVDYSCLLYNKAAFQQAGLDPEQPPACWESLAEYCRRLAHVRGGAPALHFSGVRVLIWWLMLLVLQAREPDSFSAAGRPGAQGAPLEWRSDSALCAMKYFLNLYRQGAALQPAGADNFTLFAKLISGEIDMVISDTSLAAALCLHDEARRFGLAPMPRGPNQRPLNFMNCLGWFVNARAGAGQQAAAITYLTGWEAWMHRETGGGMHSAARLAPPLCSVYCSPAQDRYSAVALPAPWQDALAQIKAHCVAEPPLADLMKLNLGPQLIELLNAGKGISPEQVLQHLSVNQMAGAPWN